MKRAAFIVMALCLCSGSAGAESALSALGFGARTRSLGVRAAGMGLANMGVPDTMALSLTAPALWRGSATTRFTIEGAWLRNTISDAAGDDESDEIGAIGAAMAVPVGHGGFLGFSLSPLTRMNYKWWTEHSGSWSPSVERHQGRGGVSQGLVGFSVPSWHQARAGVAVRALFGRLDRLWAVDYALSQTKSTEVTVSRRFHGLGWHLSLHQTDGDWNGGLAFDSPVSLKLQEQVVVLAGSAVQLDTTEDLDDRWEIPLRAVIGVGRKFGSHLTAVEFGFEAWGGREVPTTVTGGFQDAARLSLGWEFAPEYRPFDPFWKSLTYRAGGYWSQDYVLTSHGRQPVRVALTGGFSLPFNHNRSRLDLALEFARTGAKSLDGIEENSISLAIGIYNMERWFLSRRAAR